MTRHRRRAVRLVVAMLFGAFVGVLIWPTDCVTLIDAATVSAGEGRRQHVENVDGQTRRGTWFNETRGGPAPRGRPPPFPEPSRTESYHGTSCVGMLRWPVYGSASASAWAELEGQVTSVLVGLVSGVVAYVGLRTIHNRHRRRGALPPTFPQSNQ